MTWLDKDFLLQEDVNTVDAKVIEKKLNLVDQYKNKLDMLSERLDESVKKTTKIIILLDVLFLGLLIVVLFAQAVWVFRPAVKRLNEALSVRADFIS